MFLEQINTLLKMQLFVPPNANDIGLMHIAQSCQCSQK
jgi:hypothetical protein